MTTTARPDPAAEYADADDNIRSLTGAIASIISAITDLDDMAGSGDSLAYEAREDMLAGLRRCKALRERETARRDAAELAQRAAAE
jgi:hypothetical protein